MKKYLIWLALTQKRLLKKFSYIAIMLSLPLLMLAMRNYSAEHRSMMRVALLCDGTPDELVSSIIGELSQKKGVLEYVPCDSFGEAKELLRRENVDAIWVFPGNLRERLAYSVETGMIDAVVKIVWKEQSVALELSKEQLCNAIYPAFSYEVYKDFIHNDLLIKDVSEDELKTSYEEMLIGNNLFEMAYLDGEQVEDGSYILAPMRGMMALWLVLCGMAANLFFLVDEKNGIFDRLLPGQREMAAWGMQGCVMVDAVLVLMISYRMAGIFTSFHKEFLYLLLFSLCTMNFCTILRFLLRKVEIFGFFVPVLSVLILVLSPVFLKIPGLGVIKWIFPTYFYLNALHNPVCALFMLVYFALSAAGIFLLFRSHTFNSGFMWYHGN